MAFSILIRVDCGKEIGLGHAMRCLALAHALRQQGAAVHFASAQTQPGFADRLTAEGFPLFDLEGRSGSAEDASATARGGADAGADLVVLDGYVFDGNFQQTMRASGFRTMVIDDNGELAPFEADIVLNHNPQAMRSDYANLHLPSEHLIGARYTMLRPEFLAFSTWSRDTKRAQKMLVAIGGTDSSGLANDVLAAVDEGEFELTEGEIDNMAEAMAQTDIAVIGAGSMLWEAAYMGLPCIALIVADNQAAGADYFAARRCGHVLDARSGLDQSALRQALAALIADPMRRRAFAENGRRLIDGRGADRVASALLPSAARASDI